MKKTIFLLALFCVACGQTATENADAVSPKVEKAAAIANAIEADPDKADEILAKHSMTTESFRDLMYEIAADEKMSADFERSRKR